jgi:hypothetical protein
MDPRDDPRFPLTYAIRYIRLTAGKRHNEVFPTLSSEGAQRLITEFCRVFGIPEQMAVERLGAIYLTHRDQLDRAFDSGPASVQEATINEDGATRHDSEDLPAAVAGGDDRPGDGGPAA